MGAAAKGWQQRPLASQLTPGTLPATLAPGFAARCTAAEQAQVPRRALPAAPGDIRG
jgi:hypothetical protein